MQEAIFPPGIDTFEKAMMLTDQAYYMNHSENKGDEIGHYQFQKNSNTSFNMIVSCPYPCIFDQGIILGMADKFNTTIVLNHANQSCRAKGDSLCNYQIEVKKIRSKL